MKNTKEYVSALLFLVAVLLCFGHNGILPAYAENPLHGGIAPAHADAENKTGSQSEPFGMGLLFCPPDVSRAPNGMAGDYAGALRVLDSHPENTSGVARCEAPAKDSSGFEYPGVSLLVNGGGTAGTAWPQSQRNVWNETPTLRRNAPMFILFLLFFSASVALVQKATKSR